MLAVVAHDLRNPLNAIAAAVQLLLDGEAPPSPDQQRRVLRIAQRAGAQMGRLIGDLLEATRLEAGRLTLDLADVRSTRTAGGSGSRARSAQARRSASRCRARSRPSPPRTALRPLTGVEIAAD